MSEINRRGFLRASAFGGAVASVADPLQSAHEAEQDVTQRLAAWAASSRKEDVPAAIRQEALRTILNWTGCAIGGSRHETVDIAIRALRPFSGPAQGWAGTSPNFTPQSQPGGFTKVGADSGIP